MVVFVNKLTLTGPAERLEQIYEAVAEFMAAQPGLVRFQLLRSESDPAVYFNVAEWVDRESFDRARTQEKFVSGARVGEVSTGDRHICSVAFDGGPGQVRRPGRDQARQTG